MAHDHDHGAAAVRDLGPAFKWAMTRDGRRRGIVTLCIGGGQGVALAVETLD